MQKQFWIFTLLITTLILSACGGEEEIDSIQPLDNAAWPTAVPPTAVPTATPFPQMALNLVAEPENIIETSDQTTEQPQASAPETETNAPVEPADSSKITDLQPVANAEGQTAALNVRQEAEPGAAAFTPADTTAGTALPAVQLAPIASARIAQREVEVHPGPDLTYAAIDTLTDFQEDLTVLAVDHSGDWLLVDPAHLHSQTGWVAADQVNVAGEVSGAPHIVTAWVKGNEVPLWQGPGVFYPKSGALAINTLLVALGANPERSWVLVQPLNGAGLGWTQLRNLTVHAALSDLPVVEMPDFQAAADPTAAPEITFINGVEAGTIVFQRSSGGEIMVIESDGRGLRSLTHGIDPVLSPDGQTVAFTRWEQGEAGLGSLWAIDLDGSNERQILGFIDKQPKGPAWSPDGQRLVFNYQHGGQLEEHRSCSTFDGDEPPTPPMTAYDVGVKVEVDGPGDVDLKLCWNTPPNPFWTLRVVDLADGSSEDLDGGTYAFRPAWDPAQTWRIVSDGGRGLLATDVNRDFQEKLSESSNDSAPVFSPDGRFIAFTAGQQTGGQGQDIFRMNRDGGGRVRLTETPLWVSLQPEQQQKGWNHVAPAWSPQGSQIAFLTDRNGRWEIWLMNADGSNPRPMFSDEINDQLQIEYNFVDERVLSWR